MPRVHPLAAAALWAVGCAGVHAGVRGQPATPATAEATATSPPAATTLDGVWDWRHRQVRDGDGDVLIEQEQWHLRQDGSALDGYYDRSVTWISSDGNPFRCNQALRYTTYTRYRLRGSAAPGGVVLSEVGYDPVEPSRCDDGKRKTRQYHGELLGNDHLALSWGAGREVLLRRPLSGVDTAPPSLDTEAMLDAPGPAVTDDGPASARSAAASRATHDSSSDPSPDPSGVWHWLLRTQDSDGDIKTESEEWHLARNGSALRGYYDRAVHVQSADGHAYLCSGQPDYQTSTRYELAGSVMEDGEVEIEETGYASGGGPCDGGQRTLDTYRGRLEDGRLLLFWDAGHEALEPGPATR